MKEAFPWGNLVAQEETPLPLTLQGMGNFKNCFRKGNDNIYLKEKRLDLDLVRADFHPSAERGTQWVAISLGIA